MHSVQIFLGVILYSAESIRSSIYYVDVMLKSINWLLRFGVSSTLSLPTFLGRSVEALRFLFSTLIYRLSSEDTSVGREGNELVIYILLDRGGSLGSL